MKIEPNSMNVRCVTDFRPSAMNVCVFVCLGIPVMNIAYVEIS